LSKTSWLGALLLVQIASAAIAQDSPFAPYAGRWTDSANQLGCARDPHPNSFEFSEDRATMFHYVGGPMHPPPGSTEPSVMLEVSEYRVLQITPHLRVQLVLVDGALADTWDLLLPSPDRLCWHPPATPRNRCDWIFERCQP